MDESCHVLVHVDGCSTLHYHHKRRRWQEADEHRPSGYERIVLSFIAGALAQKIYRDKVIRPVIHVYFVDVICFVLSEDSEDWRQTDARQV